VIRCIACLHGWRGADALDLYLAHQCHPIAAAPSPQVAQQAASFLRHPAQSQRGENAASGAPTGDGGGASSGVSSPDAAPLFRWIGERNARPLRWGRL
jgi:hypothetical protein